MINSNTNMDEHSEPTPKKRLANLDAIRGVGVLGIFFLNIYFMGNSFYGYAPHAVQPVSDIAIELTSNFFLEGRFFSLFAIIFGAGMLIQFEKYQSQLALPSAQKSLKQQKWRLYWLILFGVIHGVFIFPGDILLSYGVSGLLAFKYRYLDADALMRQAKWFIFLSLIPIALISLTPDEQVYLRGSALFIEQLSAWTGSYSEQLLMHLMMFGYMILVIPLTLMWFIAGLMLLGMALYKREVFSHGFDNITVKKCIFWAVLLSVIDSLFSFSENPMLVSFSDVVLLLSAIACALVYIHIICLVCRNKPNRLTALQNVGKLAFSLYILQSIVGILLLRYFAPQWQQELDRIGYLSIAIIYSMVQLGLAQVYLRHFNQGPLEKLWRYLVLTRG
ncbi:DUF418 domain-containing protein [Shewanella inventionis]|uniref:DUF418 domain-containing protein n=1 Tax=Shewanella inventionis TaxID=1738770 RepID=A0ABQ1J9U6_9GAMM|nr:DUF418 domain-containing protein [Shewanella inventionis]MCL1158685.1 DUF418 domain-containing protein [Shewanella inventionis]GGB61466.1 DUF418 domain-containing protein [Shewanella inventionis]